MHRQLIRASETETFLQRKFSRATNMAQPIKHTSSHSIHRGRFCAVMSLLKAGSISLTCKPKDATQKKRNERCQRHHPTEQENKFNGMSSCGKFLTVVNRLFFLVYYAVY